MSHNEGTRFSLLEIDDAPAIPPEPEQAAAPEPAPPMTFPFAPPAAEEVAAVEAPAVDPIDAFRERMERERAERVANGLPARLPGPTREPFTAPAPTVAAAPARAVHEEIVAVGEADETTGAVVYWSMSGDLDLDRLRSAWGRAHLDTEWLPAPPSPTAALRRAAQERRSRSCLVRQHPEGGWTFVHEEASASSLEYTVGVRVWIDAAGAFHTSDESSTTAGVVRVAYDLARQTVDGVEMSGWLTWFARKLNAVALRSTGGVYFVPRDSMETFRKAKAALAAASTHRVFEIPALKSSDAIAAILDAVQREVDDMAEQIRGEVAEGLGARAVRTRVDALNALTGKVRAYEKLLGRPMTGATAEIARMNADLAKTSARGAMLEVD
jgi:hypothetical protein